MTEARIVRGTIDGDMALNALAIADAMRKIAAENSRYLRGVIDAEHFADRVGDIIDRLNRVFPASDTARHV